jgi:iron-sulfur cluster assembly protein
MVILTEQAALKVQEMLAAEEQPSQLYLRIGVQPGGCTGFSYSMGFETEKKEQDIVLALHGIHVLIDGESQPLLDGTVIDYKESMMGGGFSIQNPNATVTCGCGTSFRTATDTGKPDEKC